MDDGLAATNGLHNFRIIMAPEDTAYLHESTNVMSNARLPATVIYNESVVYYDVGVRLKSSERGRNGDVRVGFNIEFNPGELFNGIHSTVAVDRSEASNPGQREYLYWTLINGAGDFISNYNDLIRVIPADASLTTTAILMLTRFGDELLDTQFENGADGALYEFELIYYPTTTVDGSPDSLKNPNPDKVIQTYVRSHGTDEENYRWTFMNKINRDEDDFQPMIDFAQFFGTTGTYFYDHLEEYVDVDQYLRAHALAGLFGAGDSYAAGGYNHNAYFYIRPEDGKALYFAHDQDGFWDVDRSLFVCSDVQKITAEAEYKRLYYGHIHDICMTTYNQSYMSYWTSQYNTLLPGQDWAGYLSFINTRSNWALSQLNSAIPQVAFNITTNGGNAFHDSDNDGFVTLVGNSWVDVREIYLGDADEPLDIEWTGLDDWRVVVPLNLGENNIVLRAVDFQGELISTDSITVTSSYDANPVPEHLRITEVHYHPTDPTPEELTVDPTFDDENFEFIELRNTSAQTMDLTGVRLTDGVTFDFTDSAVTSLEPGEYVLVVNNQPAFEARYGSGYPIAGEFDGKLSNSGETVVLYDAFGEIVHSFAYADDAPWPAAADGGGSSLEVIDTEGDYNDAANWYASTIDHGTPAAENSPLPVTGDLDGDGQVGASDLDIVRANWGGAVTPGDLLHGDANGDGEVGAADLDVVRANWGLVVAAAIEDETAAAVGPVEQSITPDQKTDSIRLLAEAAWFRELESLGKSTQKKTAAASAVDLLMMLTDWR